MVSDFKIQGMPSPSVQVSQFSIKPSFSSFNFISRSRISPQFRASKPIRNRLHCLSLSSSSSSSSVSVHENSSNEHSFVVAYLINTFGWPPEMAISKSKYLKFKTPEKPDRVLDFFKRRGFNQTQISLVVKKHPCLLRCLPRKTLFPKFGFLISLGFSTTEITGIVTKAPWIIKTPLEKIIRNFDLLCKLVNSHDEAVRIVERDPRILLHYQELDMQVLVEAGVPAANILVFMSNLRYMYQKPTTTPHSFRKMVEEVKEMGFDPCTMKFLDAVWTKMVLSKSTWEDQVRVFKKYGWSDREIFLAFEKRPEFIMFSKGKVEAVMDFYVNIMGIEATAVANYPEIFGVSLEKRTIPRCLFYLSLLEKGLYDKEFSMNILLISEATFVTRFIKPYENEAPELRDLYNSLMHLHRLSLSSSSPSPSPSRSPVFVSGNSSNEHSFEVSYLISTFGWPPELAFSKAKKLRFKTLEKPERMLAFLKNHGFTITQISLLVKRLPDLLLIVDPEKNLLPKFEFLSTLGLSKTEITDVVTKTPQYLRTSLEKSIIPTFNVLRSLVNSDDEAVKVIKQYPDILTRYYEAEDNYQILLNAGVPAANIVVFMTRQLELVAPPTPDNFRKMVEEVKEMGFDPCSMKFLFALRAIKLSGKSIWEDKVQVLKKWGWSDHDILLALERDPRFTRASTDKIERVMGILVNKMGFEATDVSSSPKVFFASLEKTIIPRCLVYKFLLEKGLRKRKPSINLFHRSKAKFITSYIKRYEDEAPELRDIYNGKLQNGV